MSQNKKDRITPANVIALVGIAGIGVISGIGAMLNTEDGSLTWPIIWAVIIMTVLGSFLCLAIYAKGEDSHRNLWTPVMWSSLVIYIVVAVLMSGPFLKFFFVVNDKDNLQNQAIDDIANMEKVFTNYEEQRKDFLSRAETQLIAFQQSGYNGTEVLKAYFENRVGNDIKTWIEDIAIPSTDISYIKMTDEWREVKNDVNSWNYFKLPQIANRIHNLQEQSWKVLNNHIQSFKDEQELIPNIMGGQGTQYYLNGCVQFDLGDAPVSTFSQKLSQSENVITITGVIAYILLNILVLFNLLVAQNSNIIGPGKNKGPLGNPI